MSDEPKSERRPVSVWGLRTVGNKEVTGAGFQLTSPPGGPYNVSGYFKWVKARPPIPSFFTVQEINNGWCRISGLASDILALDSEKTDPGFAEALRWLTYAASMTDKKSGAAEDFADWLKRINDLAEKKDSQE